MDKCHPAHNRPGLPRAGGVPDTQREGTERRSKRILLGSDVRYLEFLGGNLALTPNAFSFWIHFLPAFPFPL